MDPAGSVSGQLVLDDRVADHIQLAFAGTMVLHDRFDARWCVEQLQRLRPSRLGGFPPVLVMLMRDPEFVRRYVVDLALGLKACIMLLNPARIVIGGGIAKAGEALFAPLRDELWRRITEWSAARIDVVPAELADDSVLYGALALTGELRTQ